MDLGATVFLDFKTDDVSRTRSLVIGVSYSAIWLMVAIQIDAEVNKLTNGFGVHACIVSAGSEAAYGQGFKHIRNLGTLVCVGIPRLDFNLPISPFMMIVRGMFRPLGESFSRGLYTRKAKCRSTGLHVVGSSVGTTSELDELLEMAVKGDVVPQISVFEFDEINNIMERLARFEISGRVVLRIPP